MKVKWKCTKCGDIITSDTKEHHKMDWCKCGESALDLEEGYSRVVGSCQYIEEIEEVKKEVKKDYWSKEKRREYMKKYMKKYYSDPEKRKKHTETMRKQRAKNQEAYKNYQKKWRQDNPESYKESQRKWREKNKEKYYAYMKNWREEHKKKVTNGDLQEPQEPKHL